MSSPLVTVLIPTHDQSELLPYSIDSLMRQTMQDFELLVVGDGAPDTTRILVEDLVQRDPRVRYFGHVKGERHGEAHRHAALRSARGRYVCYLADDDLWLPWHLDCMVEMLAQVDFGSAVSTLVDREGQLRVFRGNLEDPATRGEMISRNFNFFGLSAAGHTLDAYRALPLGWIPAPEGVWTDLHMWRQFLNQPGLRFGHSLRVSYLCFARTARAGWSMAERRSELESWSARICSGEFKC